MLKLSAIRNSPLVPAAFLIITLLPLISVISPVIKAFCNSNIPEADEVGISGLFADVCVLNKYIFHPPETTKRKTRSAVVMYQK